MRIWLTLALLLHLLAAPLLPAFSAWAAEAFVAGVEDLPLMPGLSALAGQSVVFDVPGGRIVETWAQGAVTRDAVSSFYAATLPQLGWKATAPDLFYREGETLRLEFPAAAPHGASPSVTGALLVRFYLSPG